MQATLVARDHLLLTLYETKGRARMVVAPLDAPSPAREWTLEGATGADALAWDSARGVAYVGTSREARVFVAAPGAPPTEIAALRPLLAADAFVWALAVARTGRLYVGTFPTGRVLEYDPASGIARSLGAPLAGRQYVRALAVGARGTVYAAVGTPGALVALDPRTRRARVLREGGASDIPPAIRFEPGRLRTAIGDVAVDDAPATAPAPEVVLDGGAWTVEMGGVRRSGRVDLAPQQNGMGTMGLGRGPEGRIYGATYYNASLFRVEPDGALTTIGRVPGAGGEFRVLLDVAGGRLLLPGYRGEMYVYDARAPWSSANPRRIGSLGHGQHLAHRAEVREGTAALVTPPDYGRTGGALTLVDLATLRWRTFPEPFGVQSAESVAWGPDGRVYVGTSSESGLGATAARADARLLVFDPGAGRVIAEAVPVAGANAVSALARADARTIVGGTDTGRLFEWDVAERRVRRTVEVGNVRDLARWDSGDAVLGIAWRRGLFAYREGRLHWWPGAPERLLPGLAFDDRGRLYVHDGTRVVRATFSPPR